MWGRHPGAMPPTQLALASHKTQYGRTLVTGFGSLYGMPVGVVANNGAPVTLLCNPQPLCCRRPHVDVCALCCRLDGLANLLLVCWASFV